MKYFIYTILFSLIFWNGLAQELSIKSFAADPTDLSASMQRRNDANGDACALVKVLLARDGATFLGNVVGQVTYSQSEYLVYMTKGSKRLDIKIDDFLPLSVSFLDYNINGLETLTTYKLMLTIPNEKEISVQKLIVDYSPIDAMFILDSKPLTATNGHIEEDVSVGEHKYMLALTNYVSDEGVIIIKENAPKRLNLQLFKESLEPVDAITYKPESHVQEIGNNDPLFRKAEQAYDSKDYSSAMDFYKQSYEKEPQRSSIAAYKLGLICQNVMTNNIEAVKWYRKAAEGENALGQNMLGYMYENGLGVEKDYVRAAKWYRKAAEAGVSSSQYSLACMYEAGFGVEKNYTEAVKWHKMAANNGSIEAQYSLSGLYKLGFGVEKDEEEAMLWNRKAAEGGIVAAQKALGDAYFYGLVLEKNEEEAIVWYKKAAEGGNVPALKILGDAYLSGLGVDKNYDEAANYYKRASEAGDPEGQFSLGYMYQNGYGFQQDYSEAFNWYSKSAIGGSPTGQLYLALMYQNGFGTTKSRFEAEKWYIKAALSGSAAAQYILGNMYENGLGVKKDKKQAKFWYERAGEKGHKEAQTILANMK